MKQFSAEAAFQWVQRFVAREWQLLLPVAIAFFALPGLVVDLLMPNAVQLLMPGTVPGAPGQGAAMAALTATAAIYCVGALAITALALVPGISVQEALARAMRRLPLLIGALLLASAGLLLLVVVLALLLGQVLPVATLQPVLMAVVIVAATLLWVRLVALVPVLTERALPPVAALRRSWALSSGLFWRLLGILLLYFVGGTIVIKAASSAIGVVVMLVARAMDAQATGTVLATLAFRLIAAAVSAGFQLLIAALYPQLAASRS